MKVLGISGSLRRDSHNSRLLRAAGEIVEEHGGEFEVFDGLKAIPPYDEDDDGPQGPPAVERLRRAIAGADFLLFATPEYNSSIPGVLKNAVDWASRPQATSALRNKSVAVIGHGDLRRRLGAGRAAQGPGRHRCARDRGRAGDRPCARAPRRGWAPDRPGAGGGPARLGARSHR